MWHTNCGDRTLEDAKPGSFTPWLAQEDNINLLGDTVGIELEVEAQEKSVGQYVTWSA